VSLPLTTHQACDYLKLRQLYQIRFYESTVLAAQHVLPVTTFMIMPEVAIGFEVHPLSLVIVQTDLTRTSLSICSASARISKGQGYQGFLRKRAGSKGFLGAGHPLGSKRAQRSPGGGRARHPSKNA
jgi:hypothetical protein